MESSPISDISSYCYEGLAMDIQFVEMKQLHDVPGYLAKLGGIVLDINKIYISSLQRYI